MTRRFRWASWQVIAVAPAFVYGWWVSGLAPFRLATYLALVPPFVVLLAVALAPRRPRVPDESAPGMWRSLAIPLSLVAAALVLEAVALALGGRSNAVPSLSTVLEHLSAARVGRALFFAAWFSVGISPAIAGFGLG